MIVIASLAILATWHFGLPWWTPLAAVWAYWLVLLPVLTWRDYLAGMNFWRVQRGNFQRLPIDQEEVGNETDAQFVGDKLIWPGGVLHNFCMNAIWGTLYFRDLPREVGFTFRLNRYAAGTDGWRKERALAIKRRWLNRYDPRGIHS